MSRCTRPPKEEKSCLLAVRVGSLTSCMVSWEFHSDLHELACMYSARAVSFDELLLLAALFCCGKAFHNSIVSWKSGFLVSSSLWSCSNNRYSSNYMHIHVYINTYIHRNAYIHSYIHTYMYRNAYIHSYIHTYKHTYMYRNTYTYITTIHTVHT